MLIDRLNRPIHDLRISVIDRCNFRCPYCMPDEDYTRHYPFLKKEHWLSFNDITRLTRLFAQLGAQKVRLTGGEPLLRPNLVELIAQLKKIKGIDLALTTNGSLLKEHAAALFQSGLNRLTISLDALDARVFKHMSGQKGELRDVLDGIVAAEQEGFSAIKINVVIQKGVNDQAIMDLVRFAKGTNRALRFIEYMDVGTCNHWENKYVVPSKDILKLILEQEELEPLPAQYLGEVARRYRFKNASGELGFISSVTEPFCGSCTRARLSADGKIFTCLFSNQGHDIRPLLSNGATDADITRAISTIWKNREDRYSELRAGLRPTDPGPRVEMFHIGG